MRVVRPFDAYAGHSPQSLLLDEPLAFSRAQVLTVDDTQKIRPLPRFAFQEFENLVANDAAHRMKVESVCRVENLQIPFAPESIKSQPSHKRRDWRVNMEEVG